MRIFTKRTASDPSKESRRADGVPVGSSSATTVGLSCAVIVLAALAAFHNSFAGPFVLDDLAAITKNPTIRHFSTCFAPPIDGTTGGRPVLNFTFALNYALGGLRPWGYHALNLLIHTLAGLALFGVVRRTLCLAGQAQRFGRVALPLALVVALVWVVHPLQTEAVTFISQRAESLMGLCYLLVLLCFIRSVESPAAVWWQAASVLACLIGTLTKEIIVTAPVTVLLYDRIFVSGSFGRALRRRSWYYLGLATSWLLLARLMTGVSERGAGFGAGVAWQDYALTSCRSLALYLKLAVWPHPLVFDYGPDVVHRASVVLPDIFVVAVLVAATLIALWRWPKIGFLCAWILITLAPTTSVVPVALQPTAEHRMYLPLAGIVILAALGLFTWLGRAGLVALAAAALGLDFMTVERNNDYRTDIALMSDTIAKRPENARALTNLGMALDLADREPEAVGEYEAALKIDPNDALAHNNLGGYLLKQPGRLADAIAHFRAALSTTPDYPEAHNNLGFALLNTPGRVDEAITHFEAAIRRKPDFAEAHYNLGCALEGIPGRSAEAIAEFEKALAVNPNLALAENNLGVLLSSLPGRVTEAVTHLEAAVRLDPNSAQMEYNLGCALAKVRGTREAAILHFDNALRIDPSFTMAREMREKVQILEGRP